METGATYKSLPSLVTVLADMLLSSMVVITSSLVVGVTAANSIPFFVLVDPHGLGQMLDN